MAETTSDMRRPAVPLKDHPIKKEYPNIDPTKPADQQPVNAYEGRKDNTLPNPDVKLAPQDNPDDPNYVPARHKTVAENYDMGKIEQVRRDKAAKAAKDAEAKAVRDTEGGRYPVVGKVVTAQSPQTR